MPIFYVIESGECKVEKMMSIDVRHPFNKELIRKEQRWVTVCHIAPGTIVGEEILLQPDGEEVYEYKVTVQWEILALPNGFQMPGNLEKGVNVLD